MTYVEQKHYPPTGTDEWVECVIKRTHIPTPKDIEKRRAERRNVLFVNLINAIDDALRKSNDGHINVYYKFNSGAIPTISGVKHHEDPSLVNLDDAESAFFGRKISERYEPKGFTVVLVQLYDEGSGDVYVEGPGDVGINVEMEPTR